MVWVEEQAARPELYCPGATRKRRAGQSKETGSGPVLTKGLSSYSTDAFSPVGGFGLDALPESNW
jgi:hypothetical protein